MSALRKTLRIVPLCFSLAGIVLALAIYHWPVRKTPANSASVSLPSLQGAPAVEHLKQQGLYASLNKVMTATRYGIKTVPEEQRSVHNSHFVANNPAQQLRAGFAPDGVELASATQPNVWRLGLKLQSAGYGDRQLVAGDGVPTAQGSRVEYERTLAAESAIGIQHWPQSAIKEWYVNTAEGLEQGFTLKQPPGERRGGEPLRLALALTSELRAQAGADGQAVEFLDAAGNRVLRYDHLAASDACGRPLEARMSARGKELRLEVEDAAATYPVTVDPNFTQQAYLKASNTGAGDEFGGSVAVSGDTVVVGAAAEDSSATGVNGNQADNSAANSGAAYVFVRSGATWTQQAYLKASNTDAGDQFGYSVAVSGDTVVVGAYRESSNATGVNGNQANNSAPAAGAAYIFGRSGTTWTQQAYLKASNTDANDNFGYSVAVSGDTVVVGAYQEDSSATGVNGNQADNSALSAGAAYVFVRSGASWSQQAYLKASNTEAFDEFGDSVAVSGDTVVVGAWFESSSATGVNGNQADNSALSAGAAYVFGRSGTIWTQQAYLKASNTEADDEFGDSVAVSGDTVVVGAWLEDSSATGVNGNQADNSALHSGAAYVFVRSGTTWTQQAYLKASNTDTSDFFGHSVAVSGDTVVIGAYWEDSNATGVNGNQADNSATNSGAAYVFYTPPMVVTTLADEQNTNGQCSLREAIINANTDSQSGSTDCPAGSGVDRITFSVTGTINLAGALPDITQPLVIAGPGANLLTVRRNTGGNYRIFGFAGQSATLSGLTVANGNTSASGGGVFANGTELVINDCVITGNQAATGGGIAAIFGGALTINRSTVSNNSANQAGGIYSQDRDAFIQDSTVSGNTGNDTGGIHNKASATINTVKLTNTTVSGNMSTTGASAIRSEPSSPVFSIISLTNCTVTNNSTSGAGQPGAIWLQPTGTDFMTLMNTIVSGNTSGGAFSDITGNAGPSSSYNLIGAGGGMTNGTQGNIVGVFNPQLAPLGNYGGSTQTHLLLAGSPAHNAGTITGAPAMDQRGYTRPVGGVVDIGAVENDVTLTIAPNTLPGGQMGQPYSQQLSQTGGATGTITWTISSGDLPPGNLTLNPSTGLLSGTPTGSGTFNFTIAVASQNGLAGVKSYSLVINPCPAISITPVTLPTLTAFTFFSQQLTASGGTPSYGFAISAGALPAGVTLSSGGLLSGTPTVTGAYNFTVSAIDFNFCTGERQYSGTIAANPGLMFYPLPVPVRLLDTRPGTSPNACTQPNMPIAANTSITQLGRDICTIPPTARAITGNVTTVNSGGGFLTLYPSDASRPLVATTNYRLNEVINNVFTVGLGAADGAFNIYASTATDVVADVTGYYAPPGAGGLYFHPLPAPVRLLDTRPGATVGCVRPGAPLATGSETPQTATTGCTGIPAAARAVVGNATTVDPQASGFLTLFPADANRPFIASSNYGVGQIVNGPFTVGLSPSGEFQIYTSATTHLVVDVLGYFSPEASDTNGAGLLFMPLAHPVRLLDTRNDPNSPGCYKPNAPLNASQVYTQPARGVCDSLTIPSSASAVVGNATVVFPGANGFLTLWPSAASQPTTAVSNYKAGQIVNRHFIVGLGGIDGAFKMLSASQTDLVIDLSGYFAP
ncbi:MAG: putative Ig domain-containing protein [Acidobacteria bacterium]|nr:putative Ig domain-containing protein [Acidobacteriota bacterium]